MGGYDTAIHIIYLVLYSQRNLLSFSHTFLLSFYVYKQCFKMLVIYKFWRQQKWPNSTLRFKKKNQNKPKTTPQTCWPGEDSNFSTLFLNSFPIKVTPAVLVENLKRKRTQLSPIPVSMDNKMDNKWTMLQKSVRTSINIVAI